MITIWGRKRKIVQLNAEIERLREERNAEIDRRKAAELQIVGTEAALRNTLLERDEALLELEALHSVAQTVVMQRNDARAEIVALAEHFVVKVKPSKADLTPTRRFERFSLAWLARNSPDSALVVSAFAEHAQRLWKLWPEIDEIEQIESVNDE